MITEWYLPPVRIEPGPYDFKSTMLPPGHFLVRLNL